MGDISPEVQGCCVENDHAFDALIAAIVARAAHLDLVQYPTQEEDVELARVEGWIALPVPDSLDRLA